MSSKECSRRYRQKYALDEATKARVYAHHLRTRGDAEREAADPVLSDIRAQALAKRASQIRDQSNGEYGY